MPEAVRGEHRQRCREASRRSARGGPRRGEGRAHRHPRGSRRRDGERAGRQPRRERRPARASSSSSPHRHGALEPGSLGRVTRAQKSPPPPKSPPPKSPPPNPPPPKSPPPDQPPPSPEPPSWPPPSNMPPPPRRAAEHAAHEDHRQQVRAERGVVAARVRLVRGAGLPVRHALPAHHDLTGRRELSALQGGGARRAHRHRAGCPAVRCPLDVRGAGAVARVDEAGRAPLGQRAPGDPGVDARHREAAVLERAGDRGGLLGADHRLSLPPSPARTRRGRAGRRRRRPARASGRRCRARRRARRTPSRPRRSSVAPPLSSRRWSCWARRYSQ